MVRCRWIPTKEQYVAAADRDSVPQYRKAADAAARAYFEPKKSD